MNKIDKMRMKLNSKITPIDITHTELFNLAKHYGCIIDKTGSHPQIIHVAKQFAYSVPVHGKTVLPAYVKDVRDFLNKYWPLEEMKEEK